jgi:hypothetical protein
MKHNQRAIITSINDHNKNFEVKITNYPTDNFTLSFEGDDDGNVLLSLPKEKYGDYFEVGDVIEFKKMDKPDFEIVNLTCEILRLSKF